MSLVTVNSARSAKSLILKRHASGVVFSNRVKVTRKLRIDALLNPVPTNTPPGSKYTIPAVLVSNRATEIPSHFEDGAHDELINKGGRYATLHRVQADIHEVR